MVWPKLIGIILTLGISPFLLYRARNQTAGRQRQQIKVLTLARRETQIIKLLVFVFILPMLALSTLFPNLLYGVPEHPKVRPRYFLARAYQKRRELDKAVPLFKEIIDNPLARIDLRYQWRDLAGSNLASIYINGGLFAEADQLLMSLNPVGYVIANRASIRLIQQRPEEALLLLDQYPNLAHEAAYQLSRAQTFQMLGQCWKARPAYEEAKRLDPFVPKWECP